MAKPSKSDRLAFNIGQVTLKYNDIQFWFFWLFRALMHEAFYLAHPTFFSIKSDRGQRDMVRFLAMERLKEYPDDLKKLSTYVERANQFGGRRNDILHAMWDYERPGADPKVHFPLHNRLIGKDAEHEITALMRDLCAFEIELFEFFEKVRDTLQDDSERYTRKLVYEAFAKGLQPPPRDQEAKPRGPRNGRKGSR